MTYAILVLIMCSHEGSVRHELRKCAEAVHGRPLRITEQFKGLGGPYPFPKLCVKQTSMVLSHSGITETRSGYELSS